MGTIMTTFLVVVTEGAESLVVVEASLSSSRSLVITKELPAIVESASSTIAIIIVSTIRVPALHRVIEEGSSNILKVERLTLDATRPIDVTMP